MRTPSGSRFDPAQPVVSWEEPAEVDVAAYDVFLVRYRDEEMSTQGLFSTEHRGVVCVEVPADRRSFVDYVGPHVSRAHDVLGYYYVAVYARAADENNTMPPVDGIPEIERILLFEA